ncbi:hypothetical protein Taro_006239, partial [Colocasia esculenta]|nr:hypothetical protein [Colocasia esculenta]
MSNCLWDEVNNNDDDLQYMLGEHTPVKDCVDFDYLISDNGEYASLILIQEQNSDKGKDGVEESVESSQQKRRRMLQFNSDDADSISMELSSTFIKSKIGDSFMEEGVNNENMQWDAHEFLNFLLNELADILEKELNDVKGSPETSSPSEKNGNGLQNSPVNGVKEEPQMTWVHKSFQVGQSFLSCAISLQ